MEFINIPPKELLPIIPDEMGRKLTGLILKAFTDKGLSYKVNTKYRIWCYIKKSKEALIINSCEMKNGEPYFNLQLRIKDMSTFEKLDEYSENVKMRFLFIFPPVGRLTVKMTDVNISFITTKRISALSRAVQ